MKTKAKILENWLNEYGFSINDTLRPEGVSVRFVKGIKKALYGAMQEFASQEHQITDEEIEEQSNKLHYDNIYGKNGWVCGAKWLRDRIKKDSTKITDCCGLQNSENCNTCDKIKQEKPAITHKHILMTSEEYYSRDKLFERKKK